MPGAPSATKPADQRDRTPRGLAESPAGRLLSPSLETSVTTEGLMEAGDADDGTSRARAPSWASRAPSSSRSWSGRSPGCWSATCEGPARLWEDRWIRHCAMG
jgi:hypothetical protein